jgi:hypothetical protein
MSKANSNRASKSDFPLRQKANSIKAAPKQKQTEDKQKPLLQRFAVNLPEALADELERLIEVMTYANNVRHSDDTSTLKIKAVQAIIAGAQQYWAADLSVAVKRMRAEVNRDASSAAQTQGWNDFADQQDEINVGTPDESPKMANRSSAGAIRPRQLRLLT